MLRTLTKIGLAFAIATWAHALYALDPSDIQWAIASTPDPQDAAPRPPTASGHPAHPAAGVTFDEENLTPDQQPTPMAGVTAMIDALGPLANKTLWVPGSGFDARIEITAAKREPTLRVIGVEIDPAIAESARRYVAFHGLSDRVQIITGDAITTDVKADIGAGFLFPDTLAALASKIKPLERFASYAHEIPGVFNRHGKSPDGAFFLYVRPTPQAVMQTFRQPVAYWRGVQYTRAKPGCNCAMCRSIRQQLAAFSSTPKFSSQPKSSGHWETRLVCVNGRCRMQQVWVPN